MEDLKKQNEQMVGEGGVNKPKKKKKLALFVILGVLLVAGISAIYFFIIRKENLLSFIDDIVISNDTYLTETEDIDEEMTDLPEDFLDSEPVSTEDVDTSIEELDAQLEELDNLDIDFSLDAADVGL
jgi:flagellar basal body-associated protein FliL